MHLFYLARRRRLYWSKPNQIAGLRLKAIVDGKEIALEGKDPKFSRTGASTLHITWPLTTINGAFEIDLNERQVKMQLTSTRSISWYFDLTSAENVNLPFEGINTNNLNCSFENMKYIVKADIGSFSKP